MTNFLTLSKVCKSFWQDLTEVQVFNQVSFRFDLQFTYAVVGPSGSGKSTLIALLAGIDQPDSGEILWNDQFQINSLNWQAKALFWNKKLGCVFQHPGLIKELTVLENVVLKGLIANQDEASEKAIYFLEKLGLGHRIYFYPVALSRGEAQRVAIARALMCNEGYILADEPTASLDRKNGEIVMDLLLKLADEQSLGLIVSTHDDYVFDSMQKIVLINTGQITLK